LPNTLCVGGSWIAPKALVATGAWDEITQIARRAASLLQ
jgi:2-dehydro-3-deoxyphosphogluconate aldolase/(4S)-4-hydroxy-2-oxoglutarate aldolase